MLIVVKDFIWSQSDKEVFIQVPLKNCTKNIDILTTESFIKIHATPYYFEAFLLHSIFEEESRCQVIKDQARFYLKKTEPIEWKSLEREFKDSAEKLVLKEKIIKNVHENEVDKFKKRMEEKDRIKKSEVQNAIGKDASVRESIENMQKEAIAKEMTKVEQANKSYRIVPALMAPPVKVEQKKKPEEIPGIRHSATIDISFSKRNFMTPKRESQDPAEQEWMKIQSEARKAIGFVAEDLRPEERNPQWLKEKGDDFFKKKNYLAAISAYSTGIQLTNKYFDLFLNRSAAHFAIENFQRSAEDCSKALELLNPPCDANLKPRIQALTRRGASLCRLGFLRQAYDEFVAAIKLDPKDERLRYDAEMIRSKLEAGDGD
ncbi:unnamed protein product [Diamesa serratosioi]